MPEVYENSYTAVQKSIVALCNSDGREGRERRLRRGSWKARDKKIRGLEKAPESRKSFVGNPLSLELLLTLLGRLLRSLLGSGLLLRGHVAVTPFRQIRLTCRKRACYGDRPSKDGGLAFSDPSTALNRRSVSKSPGLSFLWRSGLAVACNSLRFFFAETKCTGFSIRIKNFFLDEAKKIFLPISGCETSSKTRRVRIARPMRTAR